MKRSIDFFFITVAVVTLLVSCNIYKPLSSATTDETKIEEALGCLSSGNFDCAITAYSGLADATEKAKRLCQVNLARAGLTLSLLIQNLGDSSSTASPVLLGTIANKLIPWTQEKQTAVESARTQCAAYSTASQSLTASEANFGKALGILSSFMDCATRVAKTDQFLGTSNVTTDPCTTAGDKNGVVKAGDVISDETPAISASKPGMCVTDVTECQTDFANVNPSADAQLAEAYNQLPAELRNTGSTPDSLRLAISKTVSK